MKHTTGFIKANCIKSYVLWCGLVLLFSFITAKVSAQQSQTIPNGGTYSGFTFPVTGCVYNWVNSDPPIGLGPNGSVTIPPFTAINNGTKAVTATITINTKAVVAAGYVVGDQGMGVYNLNSNQTEGNLAISNSGTNSYTFNADGTLLYAYNINTSAIDVINTVSNTVAGSIPSQFSRNLVINPNDKSLYFGNNARQVSVIDIASKTEVVSLNVGAGAASPLLVISTDGKTLYAAKNNTIFVINTQNNAITNTIPLPSVNTLNISPDGKQLFVAGDHNIYIVDIATGNFNAIAVNSPLLGAPVVHPNGTAIYFTDGSLTPGQQQVYFVDISTGSVESIKVSSQFFYLTLSDDGSTLYAVEESTGNVHVISTAQKKEITTILINAAGFNESASSHGSVRHSGNQFYVTSLVQGNNGKRSFVSVINTLTNQVDQTVNLTVPGSLLITSIAERFCASPPTTFTITVLPDPPAITINNTLAGVSNTYGTPSPSTSFSVSGTKVDAGILVTSPPDFEVSADNITFSKTVTIGSTPTIPPTKVYIRLNETAIFGPHTGDILLTAGGTTVTVPMAVSTVDKADLLIIADNATKIYGTALAGAGRGSNRFTAPGLKNRETIGSVTITYGPGATTTDGVQTYTGSVKATAEAGGTISQNNYNISYADGDITVLPAPLTITVDDAQRYYNEPDPAFTVKYSGFVNNESASQLSSLPIPTTSATIASPVGAYPITASGAIAANYTISYVPGTLSILSKTITPSTAFTPNGDGINDTWVINSIAQYPNCTVEIMDRAGSKVYQNVGYTAAWDGRYNGRILPVGTYYYIIKLNAAIKPLTGSLTIIR